MERLKEIHSVGKVLALLVVLGVYVAACVGGDSGGDGLGTTTSKAPAAAVTDAATTTTVPSTTVPSTTVPSALPATVESWQRVGAQRMIASLELSDIASTESGLVAVGVKFSEIDHRPKGAIFTSEDGVTWKQRASMDPALKMGAMFLYGVTEGGPGLVAVGFGCEDAQPCPLYATAWTSTDGTSWVRTPYDPAVFGESETQNSAMMDVIETGGGLVAIGRFEYWTIDEVGVEAGVTVHPAVWNSTDGVSWERSWEGEGSDVELSVFSDVHVGMYAVTGGVDGLVAVGSILGDNDDPIAAVWTSPDGRAWERIDATSAAFNSGTIMLDVTWGPGGFVAVGTEGGTEAAVWRSPDGRAWERIDTAVQPFDTTGSLSSVAALGSGFVALGPHLFLGPGLFEGEEGWVTLWASADGSNWDRVHAMGEGYGSAVVVTDAVIAVAGLAVDPDTLTGAAAVWVGPAFDPASPPPHPPPSHP
jgi:hypothetical protein